MIRGLGTYPMVSYVFIIAGVRARNSSLGEGDCLLKPNS